MTEIRENLLALNEEVATHLMGYRWVAWRDLDRFPLRGEEEGRFLASPDGFMARDQVPVGTEVPLAKDPHRYVPEFSRSLDAAFEAACQVGLFVSAAGFLRVSMVGEWMVQTENGKLWGAGASPAEALCRAALAWDAAHH